MSTTGQVWVERVRKALKLSSGRQQACERQRARLAAASDVRNIVAAYVAQRGLTGAAKEEVGDILAFVKDRQLAYVEHIETLCLDRRVPGSETE